MNIQFRKEVLQNAFFDPRHRFKTKTQTLEVRFDPLTGRTARIAHLGAITPLPLNLAELDDKERTQTARFVLADGNRLPRNFRRI